MLSKASAITLSWARRVLAELPTTAPFAILIEFRSHELLCAHNQVLNEQKLWVSEGAQDIF